MCEPFFGKCVLIEGCTKLRRFFLCPKASAGLLLGEVRLLKKLLMGLSRNKFAGCEPFEEVLECRPSRGPLCEGKSAPKAMLVNNARILH